MLDIVVSFISWLFGRWFEEDEVAKNAERRKKGVPVPGGPENKS